MKTIRETRDLIKKNPKHWLIPFMEFVDDFRRTKDMKLLSTPLSSHDRRFDALLASTAEFLCKEMGLETPEWVWGVPACDDPWFVSGLENLKAIALVESPVYFRRRKIFVLENFLERV